MEEIKFRYTDDDKCVLILRFCYFFGLFLIIGSFLIQILEIQIFIVNKNVHIFFILGFLIFYLGMLIPSIIKKKYSEKYGTAIINDNFIILNLSEKEYKICIDQIKELIMSESQVVRYTFTTWSRIYVLKIITENKLIKIKASIEESRKIYENMMGDVTLKVLYNKINNYIK